MSSSSTSSPDTSSTAASTPEGLHRQRATLRSQEADRWESLGNRISLGRLVSFLLGALLLGVGITQGNTITAMVGTFGLAIFAMLVGWHAQVTYRRDAALVRKDLHERYLARIALDFSKLAADGSELFPATHPYAFDIDVVGPGSLYQWLDVSHTEEGGKTLARWLGAPAEPDVIGTRRGAVEELANHIDLREELEAAGAMAATEGKLSATPFLAFTKAPALFATRPWLTPLIVVLPVATWVGIVAHLAGWAGPVAWTIPLVVQIGILVRWGGQASAMFELVSSRKGYVEAYSKMLRVTEEADVQSEHLRALKGTMSFDSIPPSTHMRRLDRWAGFADLRTQFPVHLFVNVLTLWDLHVLRHLEAWNRDVGTKAAVWFEALGEWEALASLAVLPALHEGAHFPEIGPEGSAFEVEALAHPLLPAKERVANDVHLGGPGTALIVTGSNMAGKSTLLRSVGLNIVLSLAGGATTAKVFKTPRVRLRASMRANDNLQKGASYFHAELTKLRTVVEDADQKPPLFFLLDELLRGTNAHAAHLGAQSVVKHLLDRGAMGLIATHDVALGDLPAPHRDHVQNAHFTDVMRDGEMVFDYRLREGIVETSNALRLLSMAGIEVPDDTRVR